MQCDFDLNMGVNVRACVELSLPPAPLVRMMR